MAVGPVLGADGTTPATGRQSKTGEATVTQAHGKYYEASSRGALFVAAGQGAGTAPGTALGTTAYFALYNPPGSAKRLSIKRVRNGYISGTLGAGTLFHCMNPMAAGTALPAKPTGGTALTAYPTDVGNQSGVVAVGLPFVGATVTQPVIYGPICSLFAELASTANGLQQVNEDVDGEIVVEPGYCYQIQAVAAAGTSPLLSPSVVWEEVPIVASNG